MLQERLPPLAQETFAYIAFSRSSNPVMSIADMFSILDKTTKIREQGCLSDPTWTAHFPRALRQDVSNFLKKDTMTEQGMTTVFKLKNLAIMKDDLEKNKEAIRKWIRADDSLQTSSETFGEDYSIPLDDYRKESKPLVDTNTPVTRQSVRRGEAAPPSFDPSPQINWQSLFESQGVSSNSLELVDPARPDLTKYQLAGMAIYMNGNKWASLGDIANIIRKHFTFFKNLQRKEVDTWTINFKKVRLNDRGGYFHTRESPRPGRTALVYRVGQPFVDDLIAWRKKNVLRETSQWLAPPMKFEDVLEEICNMDGIKLGNMTNSTDNAAIDDGNYAGGYQPIRIVNGGYEIPRPLMVGILSLYYNNGTWMTPKEVVDKMADLFPYYRTITSSELYTINYELKIVHRRSPGAQRFLVKKNPSKDDEEGNLLLIPEAFVAEYSNWIRRNQNLCWEVWTDKPDEIARMLEKIFGIGPTSPGQQKTPIADRRYSTGSHKPSTERRQQVQQVPATPDDKTGRPKVPMEIVCGLILLNAKSKQMYSRDLKSGVIKIFPYYEGRTKELLNFLRKVIYGGDENPLFGQIGCKGPGNTRIISKFFVKNEEKMLETAKKYVQDQSGVDLKELGLRNGDELQNMIRGNFEPYESDLDPNWRGPVPRNPPSDGRQKQTARLSTGGKAPPKDFARRRRTRSSEEDDSEVGSDAESPPPPPRKPVRVYPFKLPFDWQGLSGKDSFEETFPRLLRMNHFPVATSTEDYDLLVPLYKKHAALLREVKGPIPYWENKFGEKIDLLAYSSSVHLKGDHRKRAEDAADDQNGVDTRGNQVDSRERTKHWVDKHGGRRSRQEDDYEYRRRSSSRRRRSRDSRRSRSRSRKNRRHHRRSHSRSSSSSRDDYRSRRSHKHRRRHRSSSSSDSRGHRKNTVKHLGGDYVTSGGAIFKRVDPHQPPDQQFAPAPFYPPPMPYGYPYPAYPPYYGHPPPFQQQMYPHLQQSYSHPSISTAPSVYMTAPAPDSQLIGFDGQGRQQPLMRLIKEERARVEVIELDDDEPAPRSQREDSNHRQHQMETDPPVEGLEVDHEETVNSASSH